MKSQSLNMPTATADGMFTIIPRSKKRPQEVHNTTAVADETGTKWKFFNFIRFRA